ncbi:MAG: TIGR01906 family membrane protein [Clostridiales Family XIII bacterium]|jgi:integral membrane protein (TIGR01906 family)|nr:TIGR01906 family membrane protein [Clostridiales Family XIII bacterium]
MKKEKKFTLLSAIAAILIAALIVSAAVAITVFGRGMYAANIADSDLPARTGIGEEEILANYNALIDYNSVFFTGPLNFPTLPMSDNGREHFREVKTIFSAFQIALIISAAGAALLCVFLLKKRKTGFLIAGGILAIVIPAAAGLLMAAVGWDQFFVLFHQLMFNNDFWIFDQTTDPIIMLLPDSYFLQCLKKIITLIVVPAICLIILPRGLRAQRRPPKDPSLQ